jgi:hypothetical protein
MADLIKLDNLALDLCVRSLEAYGNKVSPAHFGMLRDVAIVFGGMARGSITGRRV